MGTIANRALGNSEQFGDFGVALALLHEQQQHGALIGGEVVQSGHVF